MMILAGLKTYIAQKFPQHSADKLNVIIVNGDYQDGYLSYTARLLVLDCRGDPILIMSAVKRWLKEKKRHLDVAGKEIQISFSSEVIDANTFDLEIDFPQRDKIVFTEDGYSICPELEWDDHHGFVPRT